VAVVAAGVKAPGGNSVEELWASLCGARSTAVPVVDERLPPGADVLVSRVTGFDAADYLAPAELRRLDRSHHLAVGAAQDAMDAVDGPLPPPERCGVVCGVGFGAPATYEAQHLRLIERGLRAMAPFTVPTIMPSSAAALLSMRFGFEGPCLTVSSACASGASAIGEAVELVRRGACDLVLAGGVDSLVTHNVLCGFLRLDVMSRNVAHPELASRPFDADRDGFVMGEGAGFVVLRPVTGAEAGDAEPLGTVAGYGSGADAFHLVAPRPDGGGARRCMRLALEDAGASPGEVSHVNSHGTATVRNDRAEAAALRQLFGGPGPPVTAVKGSTGHLMGASGAVEAIVTLWSLRHRLVPPVAGLRRVDPEVGLDVVAGVPRAIDKGYGLSSSFGFGGANASLVLASP
jgi:3-oxoacyl-[acyl-carrier-protein] synthase II